MRFRGGLERIFLSFKSRFPLMFKVTGLFLKRRNESLAETGSLDTGNEKDFLEGREKSTKLARNLYKPRKVAEITYWYFL